MSEARALDALVDKLVAHGEARFLAGDPAAAREAFAAALDAVPDHALAWSDLGTVLHAERRHDEAEAAFLRAALFDPGAATPLVNLVRLAAQRGDPGLARAWLDRLADRDPEAHAAAAAELEHPDFTGVEVLAVGSAPSSGSTMLADLLDSLPGVACGPESNIFCHAAAYGPADTARWAEQPQPAPACYMPPLYFFSPILEEVGLDGARRREMVAGAADLDDFVRRYRAYYALWRKREVRIFADKTPVNVNCLDRFCTWHGPRGAFIHLVRDGRAVVASLGGRGFTPYEAAYVWIAQVHHGMRARRFPNAIELRYEDILADRFELLAELAGLFGLDADAAAIEARFAENTYRGGLKRIGSWTVSEFTGRIQAPADFRERLDPVTLATLQRVATRPIGQPGFVPGRIAFADVLRAYDYPVEPVPGVDEAQIRERFAALEAAFLAPGPRRVAARRQLLELTAPE